MTSVFRINPTVWDALLPPPWKDPGAWATDNRTLGSEYSSRPGSWDTSHTPYLAEVMEAMGDRKVSRIVLKSSSQVGKSEVVINSLLWKMHCDPSSCLLVLPNLEDARNWTRGRLRHAIKQVPALDGVIPKPNSRKDGTATALDIHFRGGALKLVGANSSSGLSSTPVQWAGFDEVGRYPDSAGGARGEGDPISLGEARTVTFPDAKLIFTSTPTTVGACRITELYAAGDQRQWQTRCLDCNEPAFWAFEDIRFDKDDPQSARLICNECGVLHDQQAVREMSAAGEWVATNPHPARSDTRSFFIWSIHSPWLTMAQLVRGYLDAKAKPEQLKAFTNTKLGLPFEEATDRLQFDTLMERIEDFTPTTLPADALLITCGVDIQKDRIEMLYAGWNRHEGHYGALHKVFKGDTSNIGVYKKAAIDIIERRFHTHKNRVIRASHIAVDMGYQQRNAARFINMLIAKLPKNFVVMGVRGSSKPDDPMLAGSYIVKTRGKKLITAPARFIGTRDIKDLIQARCMLDPQEGGWVWASDFTGDWFKQFASESRIRRRVRGKWSPVWEKKDANAPNEAFDLSVYAYAALLLANPDWDTIERKYAKNKLLS